MPNTLIVGGTGMLRAVVDELLFQSHTVGLISRQADRFRPDNENLISQNADWSNRPVFDKKIRSLIIKLEPTDLAIVWTHDRPRGLALNVASILAMHGGVHRFFHIMGSAVSDPANAGALEKARTAFDDALGTGIWRPICLGFVSERQTNTTKDTSRWLSHEEIASGVLHAIDNDLPAHTIGRTRPWSKKPA